MRAQTVHSQQYIGLLPAVDREAPTLDSPGLSRARHGKLSTPMEVGKWAWRGSPALLIALQPLLGAVP